MTAHIEYISIIVHLNMSYNNIIQRTHHKFTQKAIEEGCTIKTIKLFKSGLCFFSIENSSGDGGEF